MELADLVVDDRERGVFRVHRSTMTSEDVFRRERSAMVERCWLYLGHESEVPNRNDFVQRTVFGRPLILVRDADGEVGALFNTCTHRGATLAREPQGNARHFQCFYHAWSFNTKGDLVALPDEAGYGPCFDRAERALRRPAHVDSYRGFWFVAFEPGIEPLVDYLDGATEYLDFVVDQSPSGRMRVVEGTNLYGTAANWKLMMENSIDGYHALPLHQTYFAYIKSLGGGMQGTDWPGLPTRDLGHGHSVIEGVAPYGRPVARWDPLYGEGAKGDIEASRRRLVADLGEERGLRLADNFRNLAIFPNLIVNDIHAPTIRVFEPMGPALMHTTAWCLAPVEEDGERLRRRIDSYLTFIGPGGFATPDDVEALESCQAGFAAQPDVAWSDISRGMNRVAEVVDELQMRTYWRAWRALMAGGYPPERVTSTPEVVPPEAVEA